MKILIRSLLTAAIISVTSVCVHAAETASEAVVLKVKGTALATEPGAAATSIKVGDSFPEGTIIQTSADSEVELQVHAGTTSTIGSDSTVDITKLSVTAEGGVITEQTAVIGVSTGMVLSALDPKKRAVNNYSVSTPKGVAAARGTKYLVLVLPSGETTLTVLEGTVTYQNKLTGIITEVKSPSGIKISANGTVTILTDAEVTTSLATPGAITSLDITLLGDGSVVSPEL